MCSPRKCQQFYIYSFIQCDIVYNISCTVKELTIELLELLRSHMLYADIGGYTMA